MLLIREDIYRRISDLLFRKKVNKELEELIRKEREYIESGYDERLKNEADELVSKLGGKVFRI